MIKNVAKMLVRSALPLLGSAVLLYSCDGDAENLPAVNPETLMTEESENLSIVMSENGRKSYFFKTPLLEGYTLAADPYREFRKGIDITTYQDDSMSTVNANLTANYAIYYENRKLWEAKGDVVVIKADGTELYTQQLFWNSMTKRIYSNVDTKIVKGADVFYGEGFESDEEIKQWKFRRMTGRMFVKMVPSDDSEGGEEAETVGKKAEPEAAADKEKPAGESGRRPNSGEKTNSGEKAKSGSRHVERPAARPAKEALQPSALPDESVTPSSAAERKSKGPKERPARIEGEMRKRPDIDGEVAKQPVKAVHMLESSVEDKE